MAGKITHISGDTPAAQKAAQYGFAYPQNTSGHNYDSASAWSETLNDIATAMMNQDIEQQQFIRNHDYTAEYARLVATGMNPLTAIQALSGGAPGYQPVSAHNTSAPENSAPAPAMIGAISGSAQGIARMSEQFADAQLKHVQAASIPGQMRSLQDLQASETALNGFELKLRESTFDSDVSSKAIHNRLLEAEEAVKRVEADQRRQVIRYQQKQLDWFDLDKQKEYAAAFQDIQESIARETREFSQSRLNDAHRTSLIPAQIEFMGKQGNLMDAQGQLVDAETFEAQTRSAAQKIENMHRSLGVPYNVAGAILVNNAAQDRGIFDDFGQLKSGKTVLDESQASGRILRSMDQTDQLSYNDPHNAARAAIIQGYINAGAHVVGAAGSAAMGGAALKKLSPAAVTPVATPSGSSVGIPFN